MKLRFSIGRKIGTGFSILIFLTITAFVLTQYTLNKSRTITDKVTDVYSPSVSKLEELNLLIVRSKMLISNWIIFQSPEDNPDKESLRTLINKEYPELKNQITKLAIHWNWEEQQQIDSIFYAINSLFLVHKDIMQQLNSFKSYEDASVHFMITPQIDEGGDVFTKNLSILKQLAVLIKIQHANAKQVTGEMLQSFNLLQFIVRTLGLALLVGGILIAFFTIRTIVKPIYQLKKILLFMGKGILPAEKIENRNDEIGEMSIALNDLVSGLRGTMEFANEVGGGNFDSYYKPLSKDDTLGYALLKMRTELKENERILEAKVIERTNEVVSQKSEIETQNQKLEILYKHVTDSIKYAKRIQEAILPPLEMIKELLPNAFILYQPKDIVSGDFYWLAAKDNKILFAAIDCSGHGVPGALMSIVGYNVLKHIIANTNNIEPAIILNALNVGVTETLRQSNAEAATKDGMDIALCTIDYKTLELQYAGAYNPLYLIRNGELLITKADKFPIGLRMNEQENFFTNHSIQLQKDDSIYIFSDGYADQFGGPRGKKFMLNQFKELLLNNHTRQLEEQKKHLQNTLNNWKGSLEQVDDILIIGLKF